MNNGKLIVCPLLDKLLYPIVISNKTMDTTIVIKKEGAKIIVCQPGTTEVAKSKEKGIDKTNIAPNTRKGM
jgi:hypothetical protein